MILTKMINLKKNRKNIKTFCISFVAFLIANFVYNNIITQSTASGIKFREVNVEVKGEITLDLICEGETNPNPSSKNRGLGETTSNNCKGTGTINAIVPQQRFVRSPN